MLPVDPQVTVTRFMSAVEAKNLVAMGQLWGTTRGPAVEKMDPADLEKRLTVMQRYLTHDEYEVRAGAMAGDRLRSYQIQLTRAGCVHTVPFELVRLGGGWLVSNIDLTQAGNPARECV